MVASLQNPCPGALATQSSSQHPSTTVAFRVSPGYFCVVFSFSFSFSFPAAGLPSSVSAPTFFAFSCSIESFFNCKSVKHNFENLPCHVFQCLAY
eukprot:COSAG06_NODE_1014_length_11069_cov_244.892160_16_plen_95_part_00